MSLPLDKLLLAAGLPGSTPALAEVAIERVEYDSRRVGADCVFVAIAGYHVDGHNFVWDAVQRGAVAVVAQRIPTPPPPPGIPLILVDDPHAALAPLAAELAGNPSSWLLVAGVTGTDGKTTTATMLQAAWEAAGLRAGSITTVDFRCGEQVEPNALRQTSLESLELQDRLRDLVDEHCVRAVVETSSHALMLNRVDNVSFGAAVYTRITSEHLDFHGTREEYVRAKARLLERTAEAGGIGVLDLDDQASWPVLSAIAVPSRLTYSASGAGAADVRARRITSSMAGVRVEADTPWGPTEIDVQLVGSYNAANALAALTAACATGAAVDRAAAGISGLERVSGRMERVDLGQSFAVIIDYAHTAESLAKVLAELRPATRGRLWAVFGSAGERDREKRPMMGRVAAEQADCIVITDEDPRLENSRAICDEIAAGARNDRHRDGHELWVITDRTEAISHAVAHAEPGDTVLLAGKGHEKSLIVGREMTPWNERAVAERAIRERLALGD